MDNVVILTSSDSDSDFSDESGGHSDRVEEIYESEHFMNHVNKKEYEINRNKLFTRDIEEVNIIVDSSLFSNKNNYIFHLESNSSNTGGSYDNNENYLALDDWTAASNQFVCTYEFTAFDRTSTDRVWHYRTQIFNTGYTQWKIFVSGFVACGDKSSTPLSRIAVYTADGANFDDGTLQLKYS